MMVPRGYEKEIELHEELFSNSAWKLGEIHWYIQKAQTEMDNKCYVKKMREDDNGWPEQTPFGKEVGVDKIHWYVFSRETENEKLKEKTENTLASVQKLKEASFSLKRKDTVDSYSALIKEIRNFTETYAKEINDLHEYVIWLYQKDSLAPIILFTYRIWGSTRLSDRMLSITTKTIEEDSSRVKKCVEIVLGLRLPDILTLTRVYSDMYADLADSIDAEYQGPIVVSKKNVIRRTINEVLNELATYFEFIRQSLRNILIDIGKYDSQINLLLHEPFWKKFIAKAMSKKVETQLWDFKETLEMWHTSGQQREESKVTFCGDVASFANAKGGVLIIGVTDKTPRRIIGINDMENRLKYTKEVIRKNTVYNVDFTHFQQVTLKDENGENKVCLVIAIAQTKDVVGVKDQQERFLFPIRLETGIARSDDKKIAASKNRVLYDNYEFISDLRSFLYD